MKKEKDKVELLVRAAYRCEYCRVLLTNSIYEIEHIFPLSRGGLDSTANLAISCTRCNKNKSSHTEWLDPYTGSTYPLYNPRSMTWKEHFKKKDQEVLGITTVGRATAALLFRNTSQFLPPDLGWDKIEELRDNEAIYYFMNHMRYHRLRNDFKNLFHQLIKPITTEGLSNHQFHVADFAKKLLLLELYFTRSTRKDVDMGIKTGLQALRGFNLGDRNRLEINKILSILFQQRATFKFNNSDFQGARQDQTISYGFFQQSLQGNFDKRSASLRPENIGDHLRDMSLQRKYYKMELSNTFIDDGLEVLKNSDPFYSATHYSYLTDLLLLDPKPGKKNLEYLLEILSVILKTSGYGSNMDQAKLITLRRRWWVLKLIFQPKDWQDLLEKDLQMWKKIMMFNEIRELESYFERTRKLINRKDLRDFNFIVKKIESNNPGTKNNIKVDSKE